MLTVSGWESAGAHFAAVQGDVQRQASQRDRQRELLAQRQQRLAQLEASLGADADRVLSDIDAAQQQLDTLRSDHEASQQHLEELQVLRNDPDGCSRTRRCGRTGSPEGLPEGRGAAGGGSAMRRVFERRRR